MVNQETLQKFKESLRDELCHNILPFWIEHTIDDQHGGFWGTITNDLVIQRDAPKSSVVCTRILWTYAAAARVGGKPAYLKMAERAFDYINSRFWDRENGGLFWLLDYRGQPLEDDKMVYAQAFAIYALAEYFRATQNLASLERAKTVYALVEKKAADPEGPGYFDFFDRRWALLGPARLGAGDAMAADKTMNTHLHVLEAYTNLYRVWKDAGLEARLRELIAIFMKHIIDRETCHFGLFFDRQWHPLSDAQSYGHDIEGSWLLCEAAEVLEDGDLLAQAEQAAVRMAQATLSDGVDEDGALFFEGDREGIVDSDKHWWPQAEGVVGFLNAYLLTQEPRFFDAAYKCWRFIQETLVDREHGEWFTRASRDGHIYDDPKVDPWKGPYHNTRTCLEALARLNSIG